MVNLYAGIDPWGQRHGARKTFEQFDARSRADKKAACHALRRIFKCLSFDPVAEKFEQGALAIDRCRGVANVMKLVTVWYVRQFIHDSSFLRQAGPA
jgi:hypothetical protein